MACSAPVMRLAKLLGPDLDEVLGKDPDALREALSEFHAEDIAELVDDLPHDTDTPLFGSI